MDGPTITELQRQVRRLREAKGFDISLEQRLAYLTTEVGELAKEVLKLSRAGNDVEEMSEARLEAVKKDLGMEIYDVLWNLLDIADVAGVDLAAAFEEKAKLNESREW